MLIISLTEDTQCPRSILMHSALAKTKNWLGGRAAGNIVDLLHFIVYWTKCQSLNEVNIVRAGARLHGKSPWLAGMIKKAHARSNEAVSCTNSWETALSKAWQLLHLYT